MDNSSRKDLLYALRKMRPFWVTRKQTYADYVDVLDVLHGLQERGMTLVYIQDLSLILDRYESGDTTADRDSNSALTSLKSSLSGFIDG